MSGLGRNRREAPLSVGVYVPTQAECRLLSPIGGMLMSSR